MPKSKNRTPRRPKASARSNSWFRMQASADNQVEIYIYDEIGYWGVTARQFVNDLKALGDVTHINLHINSPGGDVFDGIAIFNALKHHGASITVHIDGLAASMASVIAMVGKPDDAMVQMLDQRQRASEKRLKQYFTSQVINPTENYGRSLKSVYPGRRKK